MVDFKMGHVQDELMYLVISESKEANKRLLSSCHKYTGVNTKLFLLAYTYGMINTKHYSKS